MQSEVNLWDRLLLVNGAQSIVNLDSVPNAIRQLSAFGVHGGELGAKRRTWFYLVDWTSRVAQQLEGLVLA
jgi:hypothetical protein